MIIIQLIGFILAISIGILSLWIAAKLTEIKINFEANVTVITVATLVYQVSFIGLILSILAYIGLLKYFTKEKIFPKIILIVVALFGIEFLTLLIFVGFFKALTI